MNLTTKQSLTVSADQNISETAQQGYTIESQQGDISIKADMGNITIEGTQSVTIKCGGSSVQIGPSGVTVSGPMISLG
jgi:type VI secretion system secreted protein VgrG